MFLAAFNIYSEFQWQSRESSVFSALFLWEAYSKFQDWFSFVLLHLE
jgi:hypothetical protein